MSTRRYLVSIFIVVGIMSVANSSMATNDLFLPHVNYPLGFGSPSITTGDFNRDEKTDMATSNVWGIFMGNGDGTFQTRLNYAAKLDSFSVASGELNGDGNTDLVIANYWLNTVTVYLGNGDGTFRSDVDYATGSRPRDVAVGDFDGDGIFDIATANQGVDYSIWEYTISILLGNGDGTFQTKKDFGTGTYYAMPISLTTGDFNGDGKDDIATMTYVNAVIVFNGFDGSKFQSISQYATGIGPWSIIAGDFNGDGKADLATANHSNSVSVLIGNGDGTFKQHLDYAIGSRPYSIVSGDFNGDEKADLATANLLTGTVSVLLGNGDGTFQTPVDYATGQGPYDIVAGDFNGDGKADLATTNLWGNSISILLASTTNYPPIASAGPDQVIECAGHSSAPVTLDGSASSDPDGDPLTYIWTWAGGSAEGVNPPISLPLGTTVVTLTVGDGKATATDTVNITIRDITPPVTTATGGNGEWYNTNVISTFTAFDSCSGVKEIHYSIDGSETVMSGSSASVTITTEGIHNVTYYAVDNAGNKESQKSMTVKIDKTPPELNLFTSPNILWPPDHEIVDVTIGGGAYDDQSGVTSVVFTVTDEYGVVQPVISGFNTTIPLEAWRDGTDMDGRYYTITAVATDAAGNKTSASTVVLAPHDQR